MDRVGRTGPRLPRADVPCPWVEHTADGNSNATKRCSPQPRLTTHRMLCGWGFDRLLSFLAAGAGPERRSEQVERPASITIMSLDCLDALLRNRSLVAIESDSTGPRSARTRAQHTRGVGGTP